VRTIDAESDQPCLVRTAHPTPRITIHYSLFTIHYSLFIIHYSLNM